MVASLCIERENCIKITYPALTSLETLDLSKNQIADISPLAALSGMEVLWLSENQIADTSPLAAVTGLDRRHQPACRADGPGPQGIVFH